MDFPLSVRFLIQPLILINRAIQCLLYCLHICWVEFKDDWFDRMQDFVFNPFRLIILSQIDGTLYRCELNCGQHSKLLCERVFSLCEKTAYKNIAVYVYYM